MNNIDIIRMSIGNLWRRKLRTSLTILGVVIGTSSIILMISLAIAMNVNQQNQIEASSTLTVIDVYQLGGGRGGKDMTKGQLDDAALEKIKKMPNVEMVIPSIQVDVRLVIGKYATQWGEVIGMDSEMMAALGYVAAEGRDMLPNEENIVVIGARIPEFLVKKGKNFNWDIIERAPVNYFEDKAQLTFEDFSPHRSQGGQDSGSEEKKIKIPKPLDVKVVGILPEAKYETGYSIYMPIKNVLKLIDEREKYDAQLSGKPVPKKKTKRVYNNVKVKVNDMKNVVAMQEELKLLGYDANSAMEWIDEMNEVSKRNQLMLGGIGAISLLVAAIGITNTMIMAIYERTREIGIMKVIGAVISDIRKMFLIESAFIGFLGGVVGIIFCYITSWALNKYGVGFAENIMGGGGYGDAATYVSIIPTWLSLFAVGFSTIIGLTAGYFPAQKAMKLSALSAIKTQ